MQQMTPGAARGIDPILTEIARGYRNSSMVGMALFPSVPVMQRGGKIISFNKEDFALYNAIRAPGANTKRVQFGYTNGNYALEQFALEGVSPWELQSEASAVAKINYGAMAVAKVQNIIALRLEYAQAALATTAGNYASSNKTTLSGTSQWSDYSGTSNPSKDIEAAKEAVRAKIGRYPNVAEIPAAVMAKLRQHPAIIDRIKYTGRDVVTPDLLAALWGLDQVVVGGAVYTDSSGTITDVWGKNVVLAFTEKGSVADMGVPTFGYTYRLDGAPYVEPMYEDKNAKSDIYPVTDEVSPVIAGADAGFLIINAIA